LTVSSGGGDDGAWRTCPTSFGSAWRECRSFGDTRAIAPLLDALDDDNPSTRVLVIDALDTLNASEAEPRLMPLLEDHRKSNFGAQVTVADAAGAVLAKLK
jgi:HEAT repeat protein